MGRSRLWSSTRFQRRARSSLFGSSRPHIAPWPGSVPAPVAVDDVQLVDEVSLGLLHYLIRAAEMAGLPLAFVAASRPSAAARSLAGSLTRVVADPDRLVQVPLGPLDREAGVRLALELTPSLDMAAAAELWRRAEGSPFWLHQLAAHPQPAADAATLVADRVAKVGVGRRRLAQAACPGGAAAGARGGCGTPGLAGGTGGGGRRGPRGRRGRHRRGRVPWGGA